MHPLQGASFLSTPLQGGILKPPARRVVADFKDFGADSPIWNYQYFNADLSDLAPPGSQYTHRVIDLAVRLVVEDGLPYRPASWHLWRDHRVFVPFATIQNWVEAGGKKGAGAYGHRLPGLGVG